MKYKCENIMCPSFNVEMTVYQERVTFKEGVAISSGQKCPLCGKLRTPINPEGMTTYMRGIDGPKQ